MEGKRYINTRYYIGIQVIRAVVTDMPQIKKNEIWNLCIIAPSPRARIHLVSY